jgi:hypothetical protein
MRNAIVATLSLRSRCHLPSNKDATNLQQQACQHSNQATRNGLVEQAQSKKLAAQRYPKTNNSNRDLTMKKTQSSKLTQSEIDALMMLNQRLQKVERHLLDEAKRVEPALKLRVADPNDPMNDYEIDAKVYYTLRDDDPKYDEDDDNFMSERFYMLKNLRKDTCRHSP